MRFILPVSLVLLSAVPAMAQDASDPTGICTLINFRFCPQPPAPPPPLPDVNMAPARAAAPAYVPAATHKVQHRKHKVHQNS